MLTAASRLLACARPHVSLTCTSGKVVPHLIWKKLGFQVTRVQHQQQSRPDLFENYLRCKLTAATMDAEPDEGSLLHQRLISGGAGGARVVRDGSHAFGWWTPVDTIARTSMWNLLWVCRNTDIATICLHEGTSFTSYGVFCCVALECAHA